MPVNEGLSVVGNENDHEWCVVGQDGKRCLRVKRLRRIMGWEVWERLNTHRTVYRIRWRTQLDRQKQLKEFYANRACAQTMHISLSATYAWMEWDRFHSDINWNRWSWRRASFTMSKKTWFICVLHYHIATKPEDWIMQSTFHLIRLQIASLLKTTVNYR